MKGRILYTDENELWLSKGRHLFKSTDQGESWQKYYSIPCHIILRFFLKVSLIARLLRLGMHHFIKTDAKHAVCVFNKEIVWLDLTNKSVVQRDNIYGSRPLSFKCHDNAVFYGEYRSNPERSEVHVWCAKIDDKDWHSVMGLIGVRHVHGVYFDRFSQQFWVTTGDEDDEAKVILLNNDFTFDQVLLEGSQQSRIVKPIFTQDFVYYASDAPNDVNYIYRYCRTTKKIEEIQEVNGPIYFGQSVGGILFFSTVVEPSKINSQTTIDLWASLNGKNWKCIKKFQKDKLSFKYFQYGQLVFPNQQFNDELFCFTEFATKNHNQMHMLEISKIIHKNFLSEV